MKNTFQRASIGFRWLTALDKVEGNDEVKVYELTMTVEGCKVGNDEGKNETILSASITIRSRWSKRVSRSFRGYPPAVAK